MRIQVIGNSPVNARLLKVNVGKKQFATPTYFPAISKKEIRDPGDVFAELVISSGYPRLLVSSYDYGRLGSPSSRRMVGRISDFYRKGSIVLLDSGVFEAYWRENKRWTFARYQESVKNLDSDLYFSFDVLPSGKTDASSFLGLMMESLRKSRSLTDRSQCIPIVHARSQSLLVKFASRIIKASASEPASLGVSEKELGTSLTDRGRTVMKLRKLLGGKKGGLLHILGCGDPVSMAVYVCAGADSFDSLDWAISACDPHEEKLIDLSHFELLKCKCEVCEKGGIDVQSRVFLHNLLFYQNYSMKLQDMIKRGTLKDYLYARTSKDLVRRIVQAD